MSSGNGEKTKLEIIEERIKELEPRKDDLSVRKELTRLYNEKIALTQPQFPVTIIEIKQEETGEVRLYTKLIPPFLIYNLTLMLFRVVNNILSPKKNIIEPPSGFRRNLSRFLGGK